MNRAIKSDQEILAVANPIMDNLMEGSTEINHAKYTRDFTARLKVIVTKEHLEQICRRYQAEWGYFSMRECIANFRRLSSVAIIWKQWCTKQEGSLSQRSSLSNTIRNTWLTMHWCSKYTPTNYTFHSSIGPKFFVMFMHEVGQIDSVAQS